MDVFINSVGCWAPLQQDKSHLSFPCKFWNPLRFGDLDKNSLLCLTSFHKSRLVKYLFCETGRIKSLFRAKDSNSLEFTVSYCSALVFPRTRWEWDTLYSKSVHGSVLCLSFRRYRYERNIANAEEVGSGFQLAGSNWNMQWVIVKTNVFS